MIEKKITQDTIFDAALAAENFAISVERNLWKESDSRNIEFSKATTKYSRLYAARQLLRAVDFKEAPSQDSIPNWAPFSEYRAAFTRLTARDLSQ